MEHRKHDFEKIGKRIKEEREDLHLNLQELADKISDYGYKISRQAISDIEKGYSTKAFTLDLIEILCDLFKCDAVYLLCEYDDCKTHDTKFIHEYTGLSKKAIEELHYMNLLNCAISDEPCIKTTNLLLEQLGNYNNIINTLTLYLESNGLSENYWFDNRTGKITTNKPHFNTERFLIPSNSATFDNLLLMDIQNKIIELKKKLNT